MLATAWPQRVISGTKTAAQPSVHSAGTSIPGACSAAPRFSLQLPQATLQELEAIADRRCDREKFFGQRTPRFRVCGGRWRLR